MPVLIETWRSLNWFSSALLSAAIRAHLLPPHAASQIAVDGDFDFCCRSQFFQHLPLALGTAAGKMGPASI